jgi:hypothetical protein
LAIRWRKSEQSVPARQRTPFRRERDGAAGFRRRFRSCSGTGMSLQRIRVCAAVQVAPILRIHLSLPQSRGSELHDANETRSCSFTLAQLAYWYEPAVCAKKNHQNLCIRTVTARPDAPLRLERRAASAGRFKRTTQPTSCMFVVLYTGDA